MTADSELIRTSGGGWGGRGVSEKVAVLWSVNLCVASCCWGWTFDGPRDSTVGPGDTV